MVHAGEVHSIHLHDLVTDLQFRVRRRGRGSSGFRAVPVGFFFFINCHLEADFCRQGAGLDIADVDPRFLGGTAGDADAHPPGAHKAEENLLLLDFFASNGRQAGNTAFLLLWRNRSDTYSRTWKKKTNKQNGTNKKDLLHTPDSDTN